MAAYRHIHRSTRRWLWSACGVAGALLAAGAVWAAGSWVAQPRLHSVGPVPDGWNALAVEIASPAGPVRGWFASGQPGAGVVLLLHGVRADRLAMLPRARALNRLGHAVLLIDLQAHGESPGEQIGFGPQESLGVGSAIDWLHQRLPQERLGVIGVSLGGASLLWARPRKAPDAVVLEAVFSRIELAVDHRVRERIGPLSPLASALLLWQMPLRLGVAPENLRPIERMAGLAAPVLVAGGTDDQLTTAAETLAMFDAAPAPKQLWLVPGAAHVDLYGFAPCAYEQQVFGFLARHLRH